MSFDLPPDSNDEENVPDWLEGLQSEEGFSDSGEDDLFNDQGEEESPDWLGAPDDTGAFQRPPEPAQEDVPNWLESIRQSELGSTSPPDQIEPDSGDGDDSDWLENIREQEATEEEPAGEGVGGDFLDRIESLKQQDDQQLGSDDQVDWLSGLDQDSSESEISGLFSDEADSGAELAADSSEEINIGEFQLEGDMPDFFSSEAEPAQGEFASDPEDTFKLDDFEPEGGIPDFLSTEPELGEEAATGSESPDWLNDLATDGGDIGLPDFLSSEPGDSPQPTEDVPDFMDGAVDAVDPGTAASQDQAAEFTEPSQESDSAPVGEGDWFDSTEDKEPEDDPMDWFTGEGTGEEEDVPNWVIQLEARSPFPEILIPDKNDLADSLDDQQAKADDSSLDWMADQAQAAAGVGSAAPDLAGEPGGGGVPGWLENLQGDEGGAATDPATPAFDDSPLIDSSDYLADGDAASILEPTDLPDWLTGSAPSEEPTIEPAVQSIEAPVVPSTDDSNIEAAELPSWLQAMRPVEAVAPAIELGEEEDRPPGTPEAAGPLAGLSDILPAEPGVIVFGKPPAPIADTGITKTIQQYAQMLEAMVASEEQAPPTGRRRVALPQQIMRVAIALVLYAVVFIPVFSQINVVSMPEAADMPVESQAVFAAIESVSSGAPVLIAFEYQPGFSGEMNAAAAAMIDHLLDKGALPALIASQPIGPGLGEYFLQSTQSGQPAIDNHSYVNLGYVSGGSAALLNFATNPRTAVPLPQEGGGSGWDQAPLQSVQSIRDFALVVVLTDDPDRARAWVEQVQPHLVDPNDPANTTPMLMVVSAQAEPMVLPYYQSSPQQVNGLISGTSGGAFYEVQTNTQGPATAYWNSYNAGLVTAILIILIGGTINLGRSLLTNRKGSGGRS